jgi:hypothetical protein
MFLLAGVTKIQGDAPVPFTTTLIRTPLLGSVLYLICGPSNSLPLPLFHCRIEDA